jgi:hypothetical protein
MGNSASKKAKYKGEKLTADLNILCGPRPIEEFIPDHHASQKKGRMGAFLRLRNYFAPALDPQLYSVELTKVYGIHFPPWDKTANFINGIRGSSLLASLGEASMQQVAYTVADRIRGLIYGAALGDAVGLATEFLTPVLLGMGWHLTSLSSIFLAILSVQCWFEALQGYFCPTAISCNSPGTSGWILWSRLSVLTCLHRPSRYTPDVIHRR